MNFGARYLAKRGFRQFDEYYFSIIHKPVVYVGSEEFLINLRQVKFVCISLGQWIER